MPAPYSQDLRERVIGFMALGGRALAGRGRCAPARDARRPSLPAERAHREGAAAGCPAARRDPAGDPQRACGLVRDHRRAEHGAPVSACPQRDAQKKTLHAAEQDRPDVAQARRVFIRRQPALDPRRLVFIDETWAATNMTRRYGRCARGLRLRACVPHGHWKLTTLVAGLRTAGISAPYVFEGAINGQRFRAYIEQMLAPTLAPGDIVLLDNLRSHKVAGIAEAIAARAAQLIYLPPYSPDLNPIEQAFAKYKALLRKAAERPVESLWQTIGRIADLFSPAECRNFFNNAGYAT